MKKTLAILLSLALVICMIPATASVAFADSFVDTIQKTITVGDTTYTVNLTGNTVKYNGQGQGPTVKLTSEGKDPITPTLKYEPADTLKGEKPANAGTYKVIATVSENDYYVGDFTIEKLEEGDLTFKVDKEPLTFSGVATAGEDLKGLFGVYYKNNKLTGEDVTIVANRVENTNKIAVTFTTSLSKGNLPQYTIDKEFYIQTLLGTDYIVSISPLSYTYTGSSIVPSITVKKNGEGTTETLTEGVDYTVNITNNVNVGKANVLVVGNQDVNCVGTVNKTFDITAKDIKDGITIKDDSKYTTPGGYPELILEYNGKTLVQGKDYEYEAVTSKDVKENDKVTAKVKGKNNFSGELTVDNIVVRNASKNIANATLTLSETTYTYNGKAQYPSVSSLKMPGATSSLGTNDYTVSYQKVDGTAIASSNIKNCGTYKLIVTGKNGYLGSQSKTFAINALDIKSSSISDTFTGTPKYNPVKLQLGSTVLEYGTDYDVESYETYKPYYTVTGKGNFKGTRLVYTTTRNLSSCTVNFTDNRSSGVYGPTYYPDVTVYYGSTKLDKNSYTVTYKNSKNQTVSYCKDTGTYSVIVTGIGAYTGTKTLYFTITGTDISGYTVTLKESSVNATGYSQTPVITSVKNGYYSSLTSNDYTVSYQDATGKTVTSMSAPGTYRVVVTGKNGYSGTTYATFRIVGLPQTVTVTQDSYKVYDDSDAFKITAKATGDGTGFTYTSSNPTVASVSYNGVVTPHKVGRAVITVTTTGNKKYEPASEQVIVKVYPDKAKLSKKPWTDGRKGQLKVRWGYQDGVTKYQVRYSRDKNFRSGTYLTKTVKAHGKSYTTQSTTLSNLKRGYTYYVKVRAVYTDPYTGETYYGSWSGWRSAKTI